MQAIPDDIWALVRKEAVEIVCLRVKWRPRRIVEVGTSVCWVIAGMHQPSISKIHWSAQVGGVEDARLRNRSTR